MLKRVGTHALWSVIESLGAMAAAFALLSLVSWQQGIESVGLWSLVMTSTALAQLGTFGLAAALTRHLPLVLADNDPLKARTIIVSVSTALFVLFIGVAFAAYLPLTLYFGAILSGENLANAQELLFWILVGLPFGILGDCLLNALIGIHHAGAKSKIALSGHLLKWGLAATLLPTMGLLALVIGQWLQYGVIIVLGRQTLGRQIGFRWRDVARFDWRALKKLLPFGLRMQGSSVAIFLFEPTIRLAIGSIAGLTLLGFYEMASKLVLSLRNILTTALQVTVPAVAEVDSMASDRIHRLMESMTTCVWLLGTALMVSLAVSAPLISQIWLGKVDQTFVHLVWILDLGWWFTLIISPVYFVALGKGWADLTLINHLTMTALAAPLVIIGCLMGSALLVGLGVCAALFIGTAIFIILTKRRLGPGFTMMANNWWLGLGLGLLSCLALAVGLASIPSDQVWPLAIISLVPLSGIWLDKGLRRMALHGWRQTITNNHAFR